MSFIFNLIMGTILLAFSIVWIPLTYIAEGVLRLFGGRK